MTRARLVAPLASLLLGGLAAGCGGASGEPATASASSAGGETARVAHERAAPGPEEQARIASNQQGRSSPPTAPAGGGPPSEADVLGRVRPGSDRDHPIEVCGPIESYLFVAREAQCPGGEPNPLGGDPRAAALARVGSAGQHAPTEPLTGDSLMDMHVVDLYEVPCRSGPIHVYVCMYHCGH